MKKRILVITVIVLFLMMTGSVKSVNAEDFYDFNQQEITVTMIKGGGKSPLDGSTTGSSYIGRYLPQTGETRVFVGTALGVLLLGFTAIYVRHKRKQIEGDLT